MKYESYRHSQQFSIGEMCWNVVRLGSQGFCVPVFSLRQLVQSDVGLSCGSKVSVESGVGVGRGESRCQKVKTSQIFPLFSCESRAQPQRATACGLTMLFYFYQMTCLVACCKALNRENADATPRFRHIVYYFMYF